MPSPTASSRKTKSQYRGLGNLRSPDLLVRHPLIGIIMVLTSTLLFGLIAYYVHQNGSLVEWDTNIGNGMHEAALNSPEWLKRIMIAGFYIGLHGYIFIGILFALYFLIKRFWKEFYMVAVLLIGEGIFWFLFSKYFDRPRPEFTERIGSVLHYPSFPSGHTISGVIGFGLIAYFIVPIIGSRFWKAVVTVLCVFMMLYIGYSRFFMGAHYLTDVVAGLAAGVAWTGLVVIVIEILYEKGDYKYVQEKQTFTS